FDPGAKYNQNILWASKRESRGHVYFRVQTQDHFVLDNTFIGSDAQGGDSGSMRFLSKKRTAEPGVREFAPSAVVCLGTLAMVIVALTAVLTGGCGQKDSANGAPNTPPGGTPVQVQVVKAVTIADSTEYLSVM